MCEFINVCISCVNLSYAFSLLYTTAVPTLKAPCFAESAGPVVTLLHVSCAKNDSTNRDAVWVIMDSSGPEWAQACEV